MIVTLQRSWYRTQGQTGVSKVKQRLGESESGSGLRLAFESVLLNHCLWPVMNRELQPDFSGCRFCGGRSAATGPGQISDGKI